MVSLSAHFKPRLNGLTISRFVGVLTGGAVVIWAALTFNRLGATQPVFSSLLLCVGFLYAGLLVFPWRAIKWPLLWKGLFAAMITLMVIWAVFLIGEVAYTQAIAIELKAKARPPVLEGALLFLSLLQVPTVFFARYPHCLD